MSQSVWIIEVNDFDRGWMPSCVEPFSTKQEAEDRVAKTHSKAFRVCEYRRTEIHRAHSLVAMDFPASLIMMKFWNGRLPFEGHIIHWRFGK
jgi:hypothetical protein